MIALASLPPWNDLDRVATLRAEYRDIGEAGVLTLSRSDLLVATCGSRHAVGPNVVVAVGPNALLFFWRGHADAPPRAPPGPRFDATRGLSRRITRNAQFANLGHVETSGIEPPTPPCNSRSHKISPRRPRSSPQARRAVPDERDHRELRDARPAGARSVADAVASRPASRG